MTRIWRTVRFPQLARFASPGRSLLLPRDSITYTLAGPAQLATEFDGSAQSLYALQTGGELLWSFVTKFGLQGKLSGPPQLIDVGLKGTKCSAILQDPSQVGRILRDCYDQKMLLDAFGAKGLFLAAFMTATAVGEFFRSELNALGDLLNGRDTYKITVTYSQPTPPAATATPLDPQCDDDDTAEALCRFVVAATTGQYGPLTAEEREIAQTATDLPKRPWTITSCELEGDITVLCEIEYEGTSANSEPVSAGFRLQPRGGEYNPETGGYDVPVGGEVTSEVIEYAGLGVGGTFGY